MSGESWRAVLVRRLGWSLGAATLWVWGLLGIRMLRDGWQPLEVWFGYGLSFLMTSVYVYIGMLIYATWRAERPTSSGNEPSDGETPPAAPAGRAERLRRPLAVLGVLGLVAALGSIGGWLALRYPGPQAVPGTYASGVLVAMILGVAVVSTLIARGARR
jgi:hypothetical protein